MTASVKSMCDVGHLGKKTIKKEETWERKAKEKKKAVYNAIMVCDTRVPSVIAKVKG